MLGRTPFRSTMRRRGRDLWLARAPRRRWPGAAELVAKALSPKKRPSSWPPVSDDMRKFMEKRNEHHAKSKHLAWKKRGARATQSLIGREMLSAIKLCWRACS